MSKRNLTLLIVLIGIAGLAVFAYFYFGRPATGQNTGTSDEGEDTNFFSELFPSRGSGAETSTDEEEGASSEEPYIVNTKTEQSGERLKKISSFPIAGYGLFNKERFVEVPKVEPVLEETGSKSLSKPTPPLTEFVTAVRYVEKSTGNVYQTFADKTKEQKFSTTLIPLVHEAFFGNNGENVLMRYLKLDRSTIATFAGVLDKEILGADGASSVDVEGTFLPENITDLSISTDGTKMFYLFNIKGSAVGIISAPDGSKKTQVFDSPLTEWLSQFPNNGMVTLTTKASSGVGGFMYYIDPTRGSLNKVLGPVSGLTTQTSPDGKLVLYGNDNLALSIYNISTKKTSSLNVRTLPEKCAFSEDSLFVYCSVPRLPPFGDYPDDWYQGQISFSDDIWRIDTETNVASIILNLANLEEGIDGVKLTTEDDYLFFINKKDSYLWQFRLR